MNGLRLAGYGPMNGDMYPSEGRLEVQINGQWGTVCQTSGFGAKEVAAVCRHLGLEYGGELRDAASYYPNVASLPVVARSVACRGNETSLLNCTITAGSNCTVATTQPVALACSKGASPAASFNGCMHLSSMRVWCSALCLASQLGSAAPQLGALAGSCVKDAAGSGILHTTRAQCNRHAMSPIVLHMHSRPLAAAVLAHTATIATCNRAFCACTGINLRCMH